jgi:NADPH:quinone reductase-like Zn-dependent oxidoreductase
LGADGVIDYTQEDFTQTGQTYNIIFDAVGKSSFSRCKGSLKQGGTYLTVVPTLEIFPSLFISSKSKRKKVRFGAMGLRKSAEKVKDLLILKEIIEEGKINAAIDRTYPLEQIAEAHRYVEQGHKKGNVVISVKYD